MKLLNFSTPDNPALRLGVKTDSGIVDVPAAVGDADLPTTMAAVIDGGLPALTDFIATLPAEGDWLVDEATVSYGPCLLNPEKIICIGLNYRKHAEEAGLTPPDTPILFSKYNNTLAGSGETVPLPASGKNYDYEVELGVVIGKTARNVSEEEALDYVFGYCTANDMSVRDLQVRTSQWLLGKTPDKHFPIGPYLVSADEVADPHDLRIQCWVNGELRQDSKTGDMIFNIMQSISYISQHFTLKPGDIISTGTPSGVIMGMPEPRPWLKPGDEVAIEVEGLGRCVNTMA